MSPFCPGIMPHAFFFPAETFVDSCWRGIRSVAGTYPPSLMQLPHHTPRGNRENFKLQALETAVSKRISQPNSHRPALAWTAMPNSTPVQPCATCMCWPKGKAKEHGHTSHMVIQRINPSCPTWSAEQLQVFQSPQNFQGQGRRWNGWFPHRGTNGKETQDRAVSRTAKDCRKTGGFF